MTAGDLAKDAIDSNVLRFDSELFIQCLSAGDLSSSISIGIDRVDGNALVPRVQFVSSEAIGVYYRLKFDGFREIVREELIELLRSIVSDDNDHVIRCWRTIFPDDPLPYSDDEEDRAP